MCTYECHVQFYFLFKARSFCSEAKHQIDTEKTKKDELEHLSALIPILENNRTAWNDHNSVLKIIHQKKLLLLFNNQFWS